MALNRGNRQPFYLPMKLREPVSANGQSPNTTATPSILDQFQTIGCTFKDSSKVRKVSFASESTLYSPSDEKHPSSFERAIQKTKAKFSRRSNNSELMSDNDDEFAKLKESEIQKWKKTAECQNVSASEQVKFGMRGAKMNIA
ncbi:Hypothetical protein R9X50_00161700 [Acrodontium crateriforme]|uniref:Uncharacterized protein n=1 Tax=Acrodontium crateriforme TaxID=150365 RepID=A0AAQ3M116_9PEZI|nr:Hypothetical protein R9X50_00161700 [Acrodontium crateriforme]